MELDEEYFLNIFTQGKNSLVADGTAVDHHNDDRHATGHSAAGPPAARRSATEHPDIAPSTADCPAAGRPTIDRSAVEYLAAGRYATRNPTVGRPTAGRPTADCPAAERPAIDRSAIDHSAAIDSADEKKLPYNTPRNILIK